MQDLPARDGDAAQKRLPEKLMAEAELRIRLARRDEVRSLGLVDSINTARCPSR
jgi:hypothetical protein